jgi:hypothetical protein
MYCHTNNLARVQEAALVGGCDADCGLWLDFGELAFAVMFPYDSQPMYEVSWRAGVMEFPDFASALDYCCANA